MSLAWFGGQRERVLATVKALQEVLRLHIADTSKHAAHTPAYTEDTPIPEGEAASVPPSK